ncbi:TRAP transporter small permease [Rhodovarius crocodyli]|uniref:TRAP transporter small permease protein n=1 Tax=Rhodovarius crocodyli TaxID=1979269 RepID=A0A437MEL0_9PROT|nr:TRAP transporter small permease [Rhodovarius crocodyli]RVT96056.1 TRAP transporter small permease [Rhodovarius crocodyli]
MRQVTGALAFVLKASLVLAVLVMFAAIVIQVVMRYVFLAAPPWSEELAVLMFSWATLGGLALGVREGFHVALTLLPEALPPAPRAALGRAIALFVAVLSGYLFWSGLRFMDMAGGSFSAAMEYPTEILNVMAPIAGALCCVFALEHALLPEREA